MTPPAHGRLRRLWFDIHLWIGVGLAVLLIPLGLTGAALVWSDAIEAASPGRAIVGAPKPTLAPSAFLEAASPALPPGTRATALRWPRQAGEPVAVLARGRPAPGATRAPPVTVWMNPSDAKVLSVQVGRPGWWMTLHGFHETLLVKGWGRPVVGWLGVAMLVSSLTGLWLWWPRAGAVVRGLRFARTPGFWLNLHHMAGFWISLPLAFVSLTGVGLGFPQQTRALIGAFAPVSPPPGRRLDAGAPDGGASHGGGEHAGRVRRGGGGDPAAGRWRPSLTPEGAMERAQLHPDQLAVLTLPSRASPVWRIESRDGAPLEVDDASGGVRAAAPPLGGDVAWRWIHRLHGGTDLPLAWRLVVTLAGLAPTLLGVTGVCVWAARLRRRQRLRATG